jgi:holo-[acyl-carrier protein] synthase
VTGGVVGIGLDLVEVERVAGALERHGDRFERRLFTESESAYCRSMAHPERHFAARFAAKEAVSKCFGTGIGEGMGWLDIEIVRGATGAPACVLRGAAAETARRAGAREVLVSLSHTDRHAIAQAVAVG